MTPEYLTDAIIGTLRDYSLEVGDPVEPRAFVRHLEKHGLMIVPQLIANGQTSRHGRGR